MFKNILVPLDGSGFAEMALPYAKELALKYDSRITLVRIINDVPATVPATSIYDVESYLYEQEREQKDGFDYLDSLRGRLQQEGFKVSIFCRSGIPVAEKILSLVEPQNVDVIVMSTHGRSGLGRLFFGSVAEELLRRSKVPVLLVRNQLVEKKAESGEVKAVS